MATSARIFRLELYKEHLEEAAYLYEQRRSLLSDPEISWPRLADFEERLEAHVDALVIGGGAALDMCRERMLSGEAGELFVAVCVICRYRDARLLSEVWRALDISDADKVSAVRVALNWELPASWEAACVQAIARRDSRLFPILAPVCGYRRIAAGDQIAETLLTQPESATAEALWALSRLPPSAATHRALAACYQSDAPTIKSAAALSLLRIDRRATLQSCRSALVTGNWPELVLGLSGDRSSSAVLRDRLASGEATASTVEALGLLGDLSVVRSLCECLSTETLSEAASQALYWITGAALFEQKLEPEEVIEDELFPNELAKWREFGEAPKRADGNPFGAITRKLTCDVEIWERWLREHSSEFQAQLRYRRGKPYSPQVIVDCITDSDVPHAFRALAFEELVLCYACPVAFEVDWPVTRQREALVGLHQWAQQAETRFEPGEW